LIFIKIKNLKVDDKKDLKVKTHVMFVVKVPQKKGIAFPKTTSLC